MTDWRLSMQAIRPRFLQLFQRFQRCLMLRCRFALLILSGARMISVASAAPPVVPLASELLSAACRTSAESAKSTSVAALLPPLNRAAAVGEWLSASVDQRDWSGYLSRYVLPLTSVDGAAGAGPAIAPVWEAGALLTGDAGHAPQPVPAARQIYKAVVQADGALQGQPFVWEALSASQQRMLDRRAPASRVPDGLGPRRLDFLRGARSDEGSVFRRRRSVLGDALHSAPVLVAAPAGTAQDAEYQAFRRRYASRRPLVYLGANDGMLHAFDMADGRERYAYVPNALFPYLSLLSDPAYVHRAYVDGTAIAGDVRIGAAWRTVLVAALGAGAQGLLALDVTDPETLDARIALWEFTDADDPMVGNVMTTPQLARVQVGADSTRAVAVFASGLNNYAVDGHTSSAGKGALFLAALDKPRAEGWRLNANYFRLITPIAEPDLPNGLSAAALLADRDGLLRFAYAGDLQGNLWRFDLHGHAPRSAAVERLFTARDAAGRPQPITQQPSIVYADDGGYLILFGTGRLLNRDDLAAASFASQSFYALHDTLARPIALIAGRHDLSERRLSPNGEGQFDLAAHEAGTELGKRGWFIDFWQSERTGERSLGGAQVSDGVLLFNTLLPGATSCSAARSRSYALKVLTGLPAPSALATMPAAAMVGLLQPVYVDKQPVLPLASRRTTTLPTGAIKVEGALAPVMLASDGAAMLTLAPLARVKVTRRAGRLSWREVSNWRELYEASR
jgi:type IV pilus assembly protein PilY1